MGKKNPGKLQIYLEYAAARATAFFFRVLPVPLSAAFGRCVGALFYLFDKRHRERVSQQIKMAFGDKYSEEEAKDLAWKMYMHFGNMFCEFVRIPMFTSENVDQYVEFSDLTPKAEALMEEGKGIIFATGHVGNWEVTGAACALKGYSKGAIARPLDNPLIDEMIKGFRRSCGQEIWDKFGALRNVVRVLKNGGGFGILTDQDAGQRGIFVPFFGMDSSTIPTVADLALRTGAPILPTIAHRADKPMKFIMRTGNVIRADQNAEPEVERARIMTEVNIALGDLIAQAPEQWLWLHRRWKTQRPEANKE